VHCHGGRKENKEELRIGKQREEEDENREGFKQQ
jgi:hypothetical protein